MRLAALVLVLLAPIALAADLTAPAAPVPPVLRLPSGVRPTHYSLNFTVIPGEATVPGVVAIDVELDRDQAVLWLNADTLQVKSAATELPATRVEVLGGHEQFVGLAFSPTLSAGRHRLTIAFEAIQSRDSTRGVFALQDQGAWYAMTQFESLSARRAFPCFDEPGFKTPWQLTLRVPRDLVAFSNTAVVSQTPGADGLTTVRFAETRPLPTYLVAFAVGPWEMVDLGRVGKRPTPMRIIVPRGRLADTQFVAHAYPQLFSRLESWFGIAYPFDKLDNIAIPITVGFSMENAGLITHGAPGLLAKPDAATPRFRRTSANVGTHEMAHQWFGDLVTTAWWDDIWLNEAFATWIAAKIVDQWQPGYDRGAARVGERAQAIEADGLVSARQIREPINSRGDIFNAFDSITYEKGATVIGMFEGWIGEQAFRKGVQSYLAARSDGTATSQDFLQSLAAASRLPVAPAFDTFLNQNGVPRVEVRLQCSGHGAKVTLAQHRLAPIGPPPAAAQQWQIPVCVHTGTRGASRETCALMTAATQEMPIAGSCPSFVFANAGGRGYYVPDYGDDLLSRLLQNPGAMSSVEFASLLYDLRALVRAGTVTPQQLSQWLRVGAAARDRHVVLAAVDLAEFARDNLVADNDRARFSAFLRNVFGPRARALGFVPKALESDDDQLLRRELLRLAAPEDPRLAAQARALALAWTIDRRAVDPGLVDVVLMTAASTGDAAMFDALLAEVKTAQDRLDRRNLMMALFDFSDPALARRGMAILLDPAFDGRESWTALRYAMRWNPAQRAANEFIMANFDALAKTVERDAPGGWPAFASGLCSQADESALIAFWKDRARDFPGAERELAQAREAIETCIRVRTGAGPLDMRG